MRLRYLSACSGIEAASVAWKPLGWQPVAFAEIDPFPCHVLHHHFGAGQPHFMPDPGEMGIADSEAKARRAAIKQIRKLPFVDPKKSVANLGDINRFREWPDFNAVDIVCGGSPCQAFSIAGLRQGLADPRGNLALIFLGIVDRYRPRYVIWENVVGVLSSGGGRDFGSFLGALDDLGYGFAWRVLDAQYVRVDGYMRAVPQRRRRVFVVGYLGDWRRAAAVLSEPESLLGDTPPSRGKREDVAGTFAARARSGGGFGTDFAVDGGLIPYPAEIAGTLPATGGTHRKHGQGWGQQEFEGGYAVPLAFGGNDTRGPIEVATAVRAKGGTGHGDFESETFLAFNGRQDPDVSGSIAGPVNTMSPQDQCVLRADGAGFQDGWTVRRLTPLECERLQGFPDGWTAVEYRGKPAADGPRYKSIGNSWACNAARWIGERIELVEDVSAEIEAEQRLQQAGGRR